MEQILSQITFETKGKGFTNITKSINSWINVNEIETGIIVISLAHTSCSLIINENADPRVLEDFAHYFDALVPEKGFKSINGKGYEKEYLHNEEGDDDMPAHIRTILTSSSLSLSIKDCSLLLGTWQAIYIWEHRSNPGIRTLNLHAIGNTERLSQKEISKSK